MTRARLNFTNATKREALHRSRGTCECARVPELMKILYHQPCGRPLGTGNTEFHHIIQDAIRPDNSLDNCAALTKTCHAIVTPRDRKVIAKAKRNYDRHHGIDKPRTITGWRRFNGDRVYAERER